jgi:hypothetical protein
MVKKLEWKRLNIGNFREANSAEYWYDWPIRRIGCVSLTPDESNDEEQGQGFSGGDES